MKELPALFTLVRLNDGIQNLYLIKRSDRVHPDYDSPICGGDYAFCLYRYHRMVRYGNMT